MTTIKRNSEQGKCRADLQIDGATAFEQVHVISGEQQGRLLHSARFPTDYLGSTKQETLEQYTSLMLTSIMRKHGFKPIST